MKTKKYKKLGIEVTETMHYGKTYKECMKLKPKGWELLTGEEAMRVWWIEKFNDWFFVEPFIKDCVAWLVAYSYRASLNGYGVPPVEYPDLGVRYCRSLK